MVISPANDHAKNNFSRTSLALVCVLAVSTFKTTAADITTNAASPAAPIAGPGNYRNLFAESRHTPQETSTKINRTFQQLWFKSVRDVEGEWNRLVNNVCQFARFVEVSRV